MKTFSQRKLSIQASNKRHFQLLEVMIAMLLITVCATPALEIYINMYKQETQTLQSYEADHSIRLLYTHIIEQLYKNNIPFDHLISGTRYPIEDSTYGPKLKALGYSGTYSFRPIQENLKKGHYLFELTFSLNNRQTKKDKNYIYDIYVQAPPLPSPNETKINENAPNETCELDEEE